MTLTAGIICINSRIYNNSKDLLWKNYLQTDFIGLLYARDLEAWLSFSTMATLFLRSCSSGHIIMSMSTLTLPIKTLNVLFHGFFSFYFMVSFLFKAVPRHFTGSKPNWVNLIGFWVDLLRIGVFIYQPKGPVKGGRRRGCSRKLRGRCPHSSSLATALTWQKAVFQWDLVQPWVKLKVPEVTYLSLFLATSGPPG